MKILDLSVFDKKFTVRDGLRCWLFQISVLSASDLFLPEQTGGWKGRRGRSGIQNHKHKSFQNAKAANINTNAKSIQTQMQNQYMNI